LGLTVIYRLPVGNRRSRKNALMHVGRHCGTRVRPVSAFMFSNHALEPTPVGVPPRRDSAVAVHVFLSQAAQRGR
jgi:hypothetical protein